MRKILAIGMILVMVIIGFTAMVNPVASDECVTVCKGAWPTCRYGAAPPGEPPDGWNNENVPLNTWVTWELHITVYNNLGVEIKDVYVWDRLGAELMVMGEISISQGTWFFYTKGESEKVFIEWDVGNIPAGGSATLVIGIGTDENPGGQQEYTTPGDYYLNSGATAKWFVDGKKYSASSNRIPITVVGEEEE